ncbi:YsnF/AvaK domain-containing protein [Phormidesmis sp. 146-33]
MNSETFTKEHSSQTGASEPIDARLDHLKSRIMGFNLVDRQGRFVGEVRDLILDGQQRLKIIVAQPDVNQGERFLLLSSRFVSRVKSRDRTVAINLNQADIRRLPEYSFPMQSSNQPTQDLFGAIIIEQDNQAQEIEVDTLENQPIPEQAQGVIEHVDSPKVLSETVVQEESIQLLEERLKVDYTKHKVGEVIVRKEIETRMIQVPVRREKLIVEQISPDRRQLAEIDLGEDGISDLNLQDYIPDTHQISNHIVSGEFDSPKTAAWLMDTIAHQLRHGCKRIRVEIELEDASQSELYQGWFDRCSIKKEH